MIRRAWDLKVYEIFKVMKIILKSVFDHPRDRGVNIGACRQWGAEFKSRAKQFKRITFKSFKNIIQ